MSDRSNQVHLTSGAADKLKILTKGRPVVRLYVAGRTCCGYRYGLAFEDETGLEEPVTEADDVVLVVAEEHREACSGAVVDYVHNVHGEGFTVRTPDSAAGCTCGRR